MYQVKIIEVPKAADCEAVRLVAADSVKILRDAMHRCVDTLEGWGDEEAMGAANRLLMALVRYEAETGT